jgi:hypothetical protein
MIDGVDNIKYCAITNLDGDPAPEKQIGVCKEDGWELKDIDYVRGYYRYAKVIGEPNSKEFKPATFVQLPILYTTQTILSVGMLKLVCTNGMVDMKTTGSFGIKHEDSSFEVMSALLIGLRKGFEEISEGYNTFITYLHEKKITASESKQKLYNLSKFVIDT